MRNALGICALCALACVHALAAGGYTLRELVAHDRSAPSAQAVRSPLHLLRIEIRPVGDWDGSFEDRWNASDAFAKDFREEFAEGLATYLTARGFTLTDSPSGVNVRVTFERFEGTRRSNRNGASLGGTTTLVRDGTSTGARPFFENLTFRNTDEEQAAFQKQFGLKSKPHFATVLFYRLSTTVYASIVDSIVELGSQLDTVTAR